MDVLFLSPHHPVEMIHFTRGLSEVGARVWGVGDAPVAALPALVRQHLTDYLQVPRIFDEEDTVRRVLQWLNGRRPDLIESLWEPLVLVAARLREVLDLPGMTVDTVLGFRDKGVMKERVAAAGLRVPRSRRAKTAEEVRAAAMEVGFPVCVKPIAGAGSANTFRADSAEALDARLPELAGVEEVSVEEFIVGQEFTFDAICVQGRPVYRSVTVYNPPPLIARHEEWISPAQTCLRDLNTPQLTPGVKLGEQVIQALGMGTGFIHMEWFLTPSGEAIFGEIGCRSGGGLLVHQMNFTGDCDLFREWARVVCWGEYKGLNERKYNTGAVFKRARGQGRILRHAGLDAFRARYGPWICAMELTPVGAPRRDWRNTLLGDGVIMVRHPDLDAVERMVRDAAMGVELIAG